MATIDSIELKLSANADKATTALNNLKTSLAGLSAALAPASSGLESMVVSLGKLVGMQAGLSSISKTFSTLANSWTALNTSTKSTTAEMAGVTDKARTMAQVVAKEYGIKGKESVIELTNAFQKLYSSVGDNVAIGKTLSNIEQLIREYARFKEEASDAGKVIREVLNRSVVKIPEGMGSNVINAISKLSHVSSKYGTDPSKIVGDINDKFKSLDVLGAGSISAEGLIDITNIDNEAQILEKLVEVLTQAEGKTLNFLQASKNTEVIDHLNSRLNEFAGSVGSTLTGAMESYRNAFLMMREISPELANQFMQFDTAIDNIAQNGNPFEAVLGGLTQLQDIHLSDSLNNITAVKDAISKFGGDYAGRAAANLPGIASALKQFDGFTVPPIGEDLMNLAAGMSKLGGKKIADAYEPLTKILSALTAFNGLTINQEVIKSVALLGDALYKFGLAKMDKAVENIPKMAQSISQLVNQLSTMPAVSENTIRLVSALGNVNVTGNMAANTMGGRLSNGLKKFSGNAFNARKASMSLASAFGRMYANFFIFFRLARRFAKDIDLASQLTEIQNVVDVTFGDMSDKMNDFAKTAVDTLGMSELTAKQIGSKYQAMGTAMGITKSMAQSTNDFVQKATNGYADVANSMADISINLTRLAGDMASFYNQDYADVAEKLQAIFTGQTKPLRAFGIDLTNATLAQYALNHGMKVNIKTMTQAEKTLLRYQYVMAQTAAAHGDFERTQTTWANSVRIATERLNQLRIVLGKIAIYTFKPLVQSFNRAMEQIIKGAEGLLNALGKIFGWQIEWSDGGIINEEADDADDLAKNMGDAADNAKKFKNFLLGIDELNLLPDNSDKDKGGKDGLGGLGKLGDAMGGFNIKPVEKGFDSIYDTLFKLGARINEILKNLLQSIDWDNVYKKARDFGKGLAKFVNGLLNDSKTFYEIGKFLAGGVNTLANAIDAYHKEFDGWQWGVDIGNIVNGFTENLDWNVIQSAAVELAHDIAQTINAAFVTIKWEKVGSTIAEGFNTVIDYFYTLGSEINWSLIGASIASGINGFFKTFDFVQAAETLNLWAKGLLDALIKALDRTDWRRVGQSIGEFIQRIDFISIGSKLVQAFWKALEGAFSVYGGIFDAAPIETALATTIGTALTSKTLTKSILKGLRKQSKNIAGDIEKLFKGETLSTFMSGFIGADSRGIVTEAGTVLGNLKNGVNAVSASLTTATKAVGGLAVGFGEFVAVKNTMNDLAMAIAGNGDASIVGSLGKLVTAVGLASGAFALLFGVPTGLIIAGATAAVAAIWGLKEATDKISENTAISALAKDMGDAGITLDELSSQFKASADLITGDIQRMNGERSKLVDMKDGLSEMLGGLSAIKTVAEEGGFLTSQALEELVGDLDKVKTAWEDYIRSQYDYMIQSTRNNMSFIASQRNLTDEEVEYFTNKINELTKAKYDDIDASNKMVDESEKAWKEYFAARDNIQVDHNGQKIYNGEELAALEQHAKEVTMQMYDMADAMGVLGDTDVDNIVNAFASTNREAQDLAVTLSDIEATDMSAYTAAITGYNQQLGETYKNTRNELDEYVNSQVSAHKTLEEAQYETRDRYAKLDSMVSESNKYLEDALMRGFEEVVGSGDYNAAQKYTENFIKPYVDSFPIIIDSEGNKIKPQIQEASEKILLYAFDYQPVWSLSGSYINKTLKSNWKDIFDDVKKDTIPVAKQSGKEIAESYASDLGNVKLTDSGQSKKALDELASGMDNTKTAGGEAGATLNDFTNYAKSLNEPTKQSTASLKEMNSVMKDIASGGGGKKMNDTFQAMIGFQSQAGLAVNGVTNVKDALEKTVTAGNGVKDISTNFGTLITNLSGFANAFMPVKTGFDMFAIDTQANMARTSAVFGESFTNIIKYGNQTIAWMKGSFIPMFSGAYWNSLTSSIPTAFGNAFKQATNIMVNLWKQFAQWANQNMKLKVNMRGKEVTGVDVNIPQYDTGGFPEDGMFMANHNEMVGQFANGKTAVANNEQIVEGIRQGVYDAVTAAMANGGQGVTVELVGDASDIFTAVVKENNRSIMRTGASPIRV